MLRGERTLNGMARSDQREGVLVQLLAIGKRDVYAGLLAYAMDRRWKPGWAAYAFKEIFGYWPPRDRPEPMILEGFIIEEWVAARPKSQRIKLAKPAPLVDVVQEQGKAEKANVVDSNGFVAATLMTPADMEEEWR